MLYSSSSIEYITSIHSHDFKYARNANTLTINSFSRFQVHCTHETPSSDCEEPCFFFDRHNFTSQSTITCRRDTLLVWCFFRAAHNILSIYNLRSYARDNEESEFIPTSLMTRKEKQTKTQHAQVSWKI